MDAYEAEKLENTGGLLTFNHTGNQLLIAPFPGQPSGEAIVWDFSRGFVQHSSHTDVELQPYVGFDSQGRAFQIAKFGDFFGLWDISKRERAVSLSPPKRVASSAGWSQRQWTFASSGECVAGLFSRFDDEDDFDPKAVLKISG